MQEILDAAHLWKGVATYHGLKYITAHDSSPDIWYYRMVPSKSHTQDEFGRITHCSNWEQTKPVGNQKALRMTFPLKKKILPGNENCAPGLMKTWKRGWRHGEKIDLFFVCLTQTPEADWFSWVQSQREKTTRWMTGYERQQCSPPALPWQPSTQLTSDNYYGICCNWQGW